MNSFCSIHSIQNSTKHNYTYYTYRSNSTFSFITDTYANVLIVGGGGGGGDIPAKNSGPREGGGGGGGGSVGVGNYKFLANTQYTITIGQGGNVSSYTNDSNSTDSTYGIGGDTILMSGTTEIFRAYGGGWGRSGYSITSYTAAVPGNGGSGGGGNGYGVTDGPGGTVRANTSAFIKYYGNNGGNGWSQSNGGGGGGAGGACTKSENDVSSNDVGGNGYLWINSIRYGAGGCGGVGQLKNYRTTQITNSVSGSGFGGLYSANGTSANSNTGDGGGGAGGIFKGTSFNPPTTFGGNGGSGIFIIAV